MILRRTVSTHFQIQPTIVCLSYKAGKPTEKDSKTYLTPILLRGYVRRRSLAIAPTPSLPTSPSHNHRHCTQPFTQDRKCFGTLNVGAKPGRITPLLGGDRTPTLILQTTVRNARTGRRSPPNTVGDSQRSTVTVVKLHVHWCR